MNTFAKNLEPRGNVTSGMDRILNMPRASAYRIAQQLIPTATNTPISWDTLEYDTDGMWSATNPSRFTIRTAGTYLFTGALGFTASATGYRYIYFGKNGAFSLYGQVFAYDRDAVTVNTCTSWQLPLNAGDYIELFCVHTFGANMNTTATTSTSRSNGLEACLIST